jgi:hypothetical protein
LFFLSAHSQASYYEGEWTENGKTTLFKGLMKLEVTGDKIKGEIIWTFLAADSSNLQSVQFYSNKKGFIGIEYFTGIIDWMTKDILFEGYQKDDPHNVIGTDRYYAKFSSQLNFIYGKTWSNGENNGLLFLIGMSDQYGEKKEEELKHLKAAQE